MAEVAGRDIVGDIRARLHQRLAARAVADVRQSGPYLLARFQALLDSQESRCSAQRTTYVNLNLFVVGSSARKTAYE